jgi:hypothetical protein
LQPAPVQLGNGLSSAHDNAGGGRTRRELAEMVALFPATGVCTMRMYWLLTAVLMPTACFSGEPPNGPLEGVWQAVEVTHGAPAFTIKPGPNLAIFSGRFYSRVDVQTQETRPVLANAGVATAEELRKVWGPFVAEAGTFELTD